MKKTLYKTNRHSCYLLQYHLVVVTKYRHPVIDEDIFEVIQNISKDILETKNHCNIIKINYCSDHIHILFEAPPQVCLSVMVNSFKTVTSRLIRKNFSEKLKPYYWKPYFWSDSYFVSSVGDINSEIVKLYIENQKRH